MKELEREIDSANRNGFYRGVRRLLTLMKEEKRATRSESIRVN